jgi:hypothetical protein
MIGRNSLTLNSDGLVSQFTDEFGRRGEDIVMTNVHAFDIKVWDDGLSQFVDLGHGNSSGDYAGPPAGPFTVAQGGNRYDTWHPNTLMPAPPYRPVFGGNPDNPKPLRAIQIHIRFYDPGGDTMRDLTFTYSLISQ